MPTKIRETLWLGGLDGRSDNNWLLAERIGTVINVAVDLNDPWLSARTIKVGLTDGPGNPKWLVDLAVQVTKTAILNCERILIHCIGGASRSPHVLARAIAEIEGSSYEAVHAELSQKRAEVIKSRLDGTY
jgi:hypothetical protein